MLLCRLSAFWLRLSVVLDFLQRLVDRKVCNEGYDTVSVGFFSRYDIISVLVRGKKLHVKFLFLTVMVCRFSAFWLRLSVVLSMFNN